VLDIRRLREQTEEVKASLSRKGVEPLEVDRVVELDASRRDILPKVEALQANLAALLADLNKLKPASAKGQYLKKVAVSTTMGPGLVVDHSALKL